jgi:hypothetical protein
MGRPSKSCNIWSTACQGVFLTRSEAGTPWTENTLRMAVIGPTTCLMASTTLRIVVRSAARPAVAGQVAGKSAQVAEREAMAV